MSRVRVMGLRRSRWGMPATMDKIGGRGNVDPKFLEVSHDINAEKPSVLLARRAKRTDIPSCINAGAF